MHASFAQELAMLRKLNQFDLLNCLLIEPAGSHKPCLGQPGIGAQVCHMARTVSEQSNVVRRQQSTHGSFRYRKLP